MTSNTSLKILGLAAFGLLATFTHSVFAADDLAAVLSKTGWDKLMGTWVTDGGNETTFGWKYEGKVVQAVTKQGDNENTTFLVANVKSGEILVYSVNSQGGSSSGTAAFSEGSAEFKITTVMPDGSDVTRTLIYKISGDSLEVNTGDMTIKFARK